ncbi:SDR family NAD(P)-dependent oxidoreductase [Streptomyces sp. NPDC056910]|uniref:SDR family NAD(P)-dependent oxidoreductase n=1 Tax=Streptomyces sp. NPDC056910 TaxID=3345964 RepID=UPI0036CF2A9A
MITNEIGMTVAITITSEVEMTNEILRGKSAVVFGGATGIGAGCAQLLAERGAAVVVADLAVEAAELTVERISAAGGQAAAVRCDVSVEEDVENAILLAERTYGRVDIVHNNAGAMHLVPKDRPVGDLPVDIWDQTMAVNLRGPMLGCKYGVRAMLRSGGGSIINTSSAAALAGELTETAYGVSKAAVLQLTRSVATQYGRYGIRCNAILPGMVAVERQASADTASSDLREALAANHLTPYIAVPADIAYAVAFLASSEARFVTGHSFSVDGGMTAHQPMYLDLLRHVEKQESSTSPASVG